MNDDAARLDEVIATCVNGITIGATPGEPSMHNNIMKAKVMLVEKVMRDITLCPQMDIRNHWPETIHHQRITYISNERGKFQWIEQLKSQTKAGSSFRKRVHF